MCHYRHSLQRKKAERLFFVSDEPPYGISMPGAGVVHHINSRHRTCGLK
jgi:hypothetical protein